MKHLFTIALLLFTQSAWAYLDPGTGSMLLQVILGGIAAVAVAIKMGWHQIRAAFGFPVKDATDEEQEPESD